MSRRKRHKRGTRFDQRSMFLGSKDLEVNGGEFAYANGDASISRVYQVNFLVVNVNGSPHLLRVGGKVLMAPTSTLVVYLEVDTVRLANPLTIVNSMFMEERNQPPYHLKCGVTLPITAIPEAFSAIPEAFLSPTFKTDRFRRAFQYHPHSSIESTFAHRDFWASATAPVARGRRGKRSSTTRAAPDSKASKERAAGFFRCSEHLKLR
ncbi:hypothetical protein BKA70DRAFT_1412270 [Coprinopsis sp. MPI-PUGE-AT-0042]|nr:hypothetical protein BKA70DRAFT_1412270 [Coprinopsis sp. MPI-PUGE-AT-0042]